MATMPEQIVMAVGEIEAAKRTRFMNDWSSDAVPQRGVNQGVAAKGRKLTCQPVQLWEQAKKCHSDLMHKSGPLSGPLIYFKFGISVCN